MSTLEIALVILVSIWSLIFLIIALALLILLRQLKKALDKINNILQTAEDVTEGVKVPLKVAAALGLATFFGKKGAAAVKKITAKSRDR